MADGRTDGGWPRVIDVQNLNDYNYVAYNTIIRNMASFLNKYFFFFECIILCFRFCRNFVWYPNLHILFFIPIARFRDIVLFFVLVYGNY